MAKPKRPRPGAGRRAPEHQTAVLERRRSNGPGPHRSDRPRGETRRRAISEQHPGGR